jgi:CRISPR/Cas system CSM-associated protein Csm3 (group 7 of RAMP superfamily)
MRKREDYLREGRNDPLSPQQLREHPYDFVALPSSARRVPEVVAHDRYSDRRLSGTLTLVYTTTAPLHIGSGVFEQASDCGLAGGAMPVRGITRSRGRPVLPGSGWKGAVRSRFEAITRSRLAVVGTFGREPGFKVPEVLRSRDAQHRLSITDRRVTEELRPLGVVRRDHLDVKPDRVTMRRNPLSPAESLFGCMGYRGRVHPNDGVIEGPAAAEPLAVAPLDSPVMHRLATPGSIHKSGSGSLTISEVEGRKQYYDGDVVAARQIEGRSRGGAPTEYIDHVPAGSTITIEIHLESLSLAELGALLVSAGYGSDTDTGILRFGGYKPVGLGAVQLRSATTQLWPGIATRSWRRPAPVVVDLDQGVATAQQEELLDRQALAELHAVTTRRRP